MSTVGSGSRYDAGSPIAAHLEPVSAMPLHNTSSHYGSLTKTFHWLTVALFAFQLYSSNVMTRSPLADSVMVISRDAHYDWHKSIGLLALLVAIARVWARRQGALPAWAPTLSETERAFVHRAEQLLYGAMFVMPVSGFVHVMAGGYGVRLFGMVDMPDPIGVWPWLAVTAKWTHVLCGWTLVLTLLAHIALVLRHSVVLRDGLLWRMWPGRAR